MGLLIAVIKDLAEFLLGIVRGDIRQTDSGVPMLPTWHRGETTSSTVPVESVLPLGFGESSYCIARPTRVFLRPLWAYDTVIAELSYGTSVQVYAYQGQFARVELPAGPGWIHREDLSLQSRSIFPEFVSGQVYEAADAEVQKLRRLSGDPFFAGELFLPLQPGELVSYRLSEAGRKIPWPTVRPRTPGRWHEILRGVRGVKIGLSPRTGSLLEGYTEANEPILGYVRSVDPSETIEFDTVDGSKEGLYERKVMSREEWVGLRPVFIEIW